MTDKAVYTALKEQSWHRELTGAERDVLRAWLAAHPEDLDDWRAEEALNQALRGLPDAPVPSNFTALVIQRATRPGPAAPRFWLSTLFGTRLRWLPASAAAAVLITAGMMFSHIRHESSVQTRLARSVATVSEVASVPSPEMLRDFDVILALDRTPAADVELLSLLQ